MKKDWSNLNRYCNRSAWIVMLLLGAVGWFFPQAQGNSSQAVPLVKITFFYDRNLNGLQDNNEPVLKKLEIKSGETSLDGTEGFITVKAKELAVLFIQGAAPGGKPLTVATFQEPQSVIMLPMISIAVDKKDLLVGLADGYLTSPIRPSQLNLEDYRGTLQNPSKWQAQSAALYPQGWHFPRNYFFYGYRIPAGGLAGTPHLAFDIWAKPGTPVIASAPGVIVKPLFDWRFGISGPYGTIYYNHIIPAVKIGENVKRYDVVGYIAENQGNHVHFELRPEAASILEAFPGVRAADLIKSPLKGEQVPLLPFFYQGKP